jgi:hypothetical protein
MPPHEAAPRAPRTPESRRAFEEFARAKETPLLIKASDARVKSKGKRTEYVSKKRRPKVGSAVRA